jgi:EAL domain-containing protein (putative c-di-GMP-specific phosphodiesterase class I)
VQAAAEKSIPPARLKLEVTESAVLHDLGETVAKLQQLRQHGFKIALDDFGTGYSSLSHLRELPLDELKIDRAFVEELDRNVEHTLVESMIAIGKHMGLSVVAEGVETEIQRQQLATMGCACFQGYLLSRPLPEAEFLAWIRQRVSA